MKKLLCILLASAMLLSLSIPTFAEETHEITTDSYNIYVGSADTGLSLPLYFLDGAMDLPYIESSDIPGILMSVMGDPKNSYTFSIETDGPIATVTRNNTNSEAMDNGTNAVFDFDNDTITFSDHDLFCWKPEAGAIMDPVVLSTINAEGEPSLLQKVEKESLDRYGDALVVRAGDYGIDFIQQDGKFYIPLQTLDDIILWPAREQGLFFNGQALFLTAKIAEGDELYYSAPTGERSEALTQFSYNELCMMLDYLYGLKDAHGIESFDKLFHSVTFDKTFMEPSAESADIALNYLINNYFDDGHSALLASSYLAGSKDYHVPAGTSQGKVIDEMNRYKDARNQYYPDGVPGYEEIGNTAYITFDSFAYQDLNGERYYEVEDVNEFPDTDTIGLIMKAHEQITREDSPIENVVIDMSNNGGGQSDAVIFTLAWLLGEASISIENTMTGSMCSAIYRADVNRDRKFDENDTIKDKNIYCLISPLSFSCGNLLPCALKDSNRATLLGRTSGGGSCAVQYVSSAWGTSFRISGPQRMSFLKNGSYYDIDRGAEPDYQISKPEKFYDRQALTDYINSLY